MTTTMASEAVGNLSSANTNLFDDFEEAFQGVINGFTKEDGLTHTNENREELKTDAEQNVSKFIEVAKQLETFFLKRRLQLSVLKPEQIIKEDCSELRQEIARKDELIKKHYDKIPLWLSLLADPQQAPVTPGSTPTVGEAHPPQPPQGPPQQLPPQTQQQVQKQPMMQFQNW